MEGTINISEFINHLKKNDLMIVPKSIVEQAKVQNLQNRYARKKLLSFNEIAKAELFGPITAQAVKVFVKKYAADHEYVKCLNGKREVYKLPWSTIERLQTLRNYTYGKN